MNATSKADLRRPAAPSMRCKDLPCWDCGELRTIRDVHRRLCGRCYKRLQAKGVLPIVDWALLMNRLAIPVGECIEWHGATNERGYGTWRCKYAHRLSFEGAMGTPIPHGLTIDHLCRNPACVKLEHLEMVTQRENNVRWAHLITHCIHGHEFTPENTRLRHRGSTTSRACRACDLAHEMKRVRKWS